MSTAAQLPNETPHSSVEGEFEFEESIVEHKFFGGLCLFEQTAREGLCLFLLLLLFASLVIFHPNLWGSSLLHPSLHSPLHPLDNIRCNTATRVLFRLCVCRHRGDGACHCAFDVHADYGGLWRKGGVGL